MLEDYLITNTLYSSGNTEICRAIRKSDNLYVIIKTSDENLSSDKSIGLSNEYNLSQRLNGKFFVNFFDIEKDHQKTSLIMQDDQMVSLESAIPENGFDLPVFLNIAKNITSAIDLIHKQGIIHKDINPSNIIISSNLDKIKIIDFELSVDALFEEQIGFEAPSFLQGTLDYISPEQTGRVNWPIDLRSDLYSLGITLYQLLTGELPFDTTNLSELIYSHIAKTPSLVSSIKNNIPKTLSSVIEKLLKKSPHERYQTTNGLLNDIQCIEKTIVNNYTAYSFLPGKKDFSNQIILSNKLYGREKEISQLTRYLNECSNICKIIEITGDAGVGKTALIRELYTPVTAKRGFFLSGNFEHLNKNATHSAFANVLKEFVYQCLSLDENLVKHWKNIVQKSVSDFGQVLIDIIPEFKKLIGKQSPVALISPFDTVLRRNQVLSNLINDICDAGQPTIIFLDDMQWSDSATLSLIETLIKKNIKNLMLIFSYRNDETARKHSFKELLNNIDTKNISYSAIHLDVLNKNAINHWISDLLNDTNDSTEELSNLIFLKSEGYPFIISSILQTIIEKKHIKYNSTGLLSIDISGISNIPTNANIISWLIQKIENLDKLILDFFTQLSILGNKFTIDDISVFLNMPYEKYQKTIQTLVSLHLLKKNKEYIMFAHNEIQQATLGMLSEEQKQTLHLQAGENFKNLTNSQNIFIEYTEKYIHHFNNAENLIYNLDLRLELAKQNLLLGKQLKHNANYQSTEFYYKKAIHFLPANPFDTVYNLAIELYTEYGEILFLNLKYKKGEKYFHKVLKHSKSPLDSSKVYIRQINHYATHQNIKKSMDIALHSLESLGIKLPSKMINISIITELLKAKLLMRNIKPEDILKFQHTEDPLSLAQMGILSAAASPVYLGYPEYFPLLVFENLKISILKGNSNMSSTSYIGYSIVLCTLGNYNSGYAYAEQALKLLESFKNKKSYTKISFLFGILIMHWKDPIQNCIELLRKTVASGIKTGDYEYASMAVVHIIQFSFYFGCNIEKTLKELKEQSKILNSFGKKRSIMEVRIFHQLLTVLNDPGNTGTTISGDIANEEQIISSFEKSQDFSALGKYTVGKILISYLMHDFENAFKHCEKCAVFLKSLKSSVFNPLFYFISALVYISLYKNNKKNMFLINKAKSSLKKLKKCSNTSPVNYLAKTQLVEAELNSIESNTNKALMLYEKAIKNARNANNNLDLGIIYENIARYFLSIGHNTTSQMYIENSIETFCKFGVVSKSNLLCKEFNIKSKNKNDKLIKNISTNTTQSSNKYLNLNSLAETVEAISTNFDFNSLLTALLNSVIKTSGATLVAYIHVHDGELQIKAKKQADENIEIYEGYRIYDSTFSLPIPLIEKCYLNQSKHILKNVQIDHEPSSDSNKTQLKSVLILPLIRNNTINGLVYFENTLMPDAFREDQIQFLTLLSGLATITIENSLNFEKLNKERKYSSNIIRNSPSLICGIDNDGTTIFINPIIEEITGYSKNELIGSNWWKLLYPDEEYRQVQKLFDEFSNGEVVDYEMCLICKNGDKKNVLWNSFIRRDKSNKIIDIIGFGNDITEHKQAEKELETYREHLEDLIEERTAELKKSQNIAIENAHKAGMADIANDTLHNIGNILNSVKTSSEIIKEQNKSIALVNLKKANELLKQNLNNLDNFINNNPKGKKLMLYYLTLDTAFEREDKYTEKHVNRLIKKIDTIVDVLAAQQNHAGSASIVDVYSITDIIEDVLIMQQEDLNDNKIKIEKDFETINNLLLQKIKLVHVLVNILKNSKEAMLSTPIDNRLIKISVSIKNRIVYVKIKDTGSGIPPENLTKVFTHGFTTKKNGNGFGLHSCANYMTEMNGKISIESEGLNKGTTFILELPA